MSKPNEKHVRPLISAAALAARVAELAAEINRDYATSERLVVIGVLKGSIFFLVDLLRLLTVPVELDFCQTASYGEGTTAGEIRLKKDVDLALRGADVLLVEDIVDTGWTLSLLLDFYRHRGPRSLKLCALLDKRAARQAPVAIDYCGFEVPPQFVVGYGLDWGERYRNLPFLGVVDWSRQPEEEKTG